MTAPLPEHPAILPLGAMLRRLEVLRPGRKVVFTNGCFDILHPGHVNLLARAKALGHILVVGVNSDDSVRRLGKGAGRPVNPLPNRLFVLAHVAGVDFVQAFDQDTPLELIQAVRPDVLVKGGDWPVERIVGREVVQARGGEVHSLPLLSGYSTTALLQRLRGGA